MSRYDRELVTRLLPAIWNDDYAYGMTVDVAPDPDMPRAKADPARGGTLLAHLADIRRAWRDAPLTVQERRALFLGHGFGLTVKEIAADLGITRRQTVSEWEAEGISKLTAFLNGEEIEDD